MKHTFPFIAAIMLMLALASCSKNSTGSDSNPEPVPTLRMDQFGKTGTFTYRIISDVHLLLQPVVYDTVVSPVTYASSAFANNQFVMYGMTVLKFPTNTNASFSTPVSTGEALFYLGLEETSALTMFDATCTVSLENGGAVSLPIKACPNTIKARYQGTKTESGTEYKFDLTAYFDADTTAANLGLLKSSGSFENATTVTGQRTVLISTNSAMTLIAHQ